MKFPALAAIIVWSLITVSCRPGIQRNIFAGMDPASKEYKQKLAREIADHEGDELSFTFNKYLNSNGNDYIEISVDGRGIHATSLVLVKDWKKLEGIKQTKGIGYTGAELKNLKVELINPDTNPTFVYKDVEKIVD